MFPSPSDKSSATRCSTVSKSDPPIRLVVLFGPTGVGKTEALLRIRGPLWEVVSADSVQVYRHMDVGTAKPGPDVLARLPHHLIDIVDPDAQFSAGEFVKRAEEAIAGTLARGRVPVVSGGTAFYMRNFAFGLPEAPPSTKESRASVLAEARARGLASLYRELQEVDPAYAAGIGDHDASRVKRALEVFRSTGRPLSSFAVPGSPRRDYRWLFVGLERPRAELHARIERRVDGMFDAGLVREVEALRALGYGPEAPGMKAIGYRELLECAGDLARARELIKRNTRRYARRQLVFFRKLPGVTWLPADDFEGLARLIEEFLAAEEPPDEPQEPPPGGGAP